MRVGELWRYPVKSMAGERLFSVELTPEGVPGDRRVGIFDRRSRRPNHVLSARQQPRLLHFRATWSDDGPLVEGPGLEPTLWREPPVRRRVSEVCGRDLELAEVPGGAFDDSPIHLLALPTLGALEAELGRPVDRRRFRANIYLDGEDLEPGADRRWVGRRLSTGEAVLEVLAGCPRCAITTRDPDTQMAWPGLLRYLVRTRDQLMGLYCGVERPGAVGEGSLALLA